MLAPNISSHPRRIDMHVHAGHIEWMRTTIELTDEQRSQLLRIAAARRQKGFSVIVQEAVNEYLRGEAARASRIQAALGARGALSEKEASAFLERTQEIRSTWR